MSLEIESKIICIEHWEEEEDACYTTTDVFWSLARAEVQKNLSICDSQAKKSFQKIM